MVASALRRRFKLIVCFTFYIVVNYCIITKNSFHIAKWKLNWRRHIQIIVAGNYIFVMLLGSKSVATCKIAQHECVLLSICRRSSNNTPGVDLLWRRSGDTWPSWTDPGIFNEAETKRWFLRVPANNCLSYSGLTRTYNNIVVLLVII